MTKQPENKAPVKHSRDAAETRARILKAAKIQFSKDNYESIGVRDIAAEADVDAALINRYFGSKERLFVEAITGAFRSIDLLHDDLSGLRESLTRHLISKQKEFMLTEGFNPLHLLLRSAMSHTVSPIVAEVFNKEFITPLAELLGGEDAVLRARLISSYIIGFVTVWVAFTPQDILLNDVDKMIAFLGTAIQSCVESDGTSE